MPVTLTLATAEVEAIAAYITQDAERAEADCRFADAAESWGLAGKLLTQAAQQRPRLDGEATDCMAQAARCAAVPVLTWYEQRERTGGPDGIDAAGIVT